MFNNIKIPRFCRRSEKWPENVSENGAAIFEYAALS